MANKKEQYINMLLALGVLIGLLAIYASFKLHPALPAHAASTYLVDSNGDEPDDNPGDDVCHTAADTCTLRAAMQEANAHTGADIINFDNGYTISPASALPDITDQVEINGYTGSPGGATANTAASPAPFNGTLTVIIDGTSAGLVDGLFFNTGSSGSSVRGMVINSFYNGAVRSLVADLTVAGNYLGTDAAGTADLGNGYGVRLLDPSVTNNIVGGTNAADRNIISGNDTLGIEIGTAGTGNTIVGNYIGVDKTGTVDMGNNNSGVYIIDTSSTTVGGTTSASINVISGNGDTGVTISNDGEPTINNVIEGNYIGTDYTGTAAIANATDGIVVGSGTSNTTIGGTTGVTLDGACTGACNIISANTSSGIELGGTSSNVIAGNHIGTNKAGTGDLGNNDVGILLTSSNSNTIGGTTNGSRNIISGNNGVGVGLDADSDSNTIAGNYIGTNTNGTAAIGNSNHGVSLANGSSSNTIGGTSGSARNIISGNGVRGVNTEDSGTDDNLILGNYIGTNTTGTAAIANSAQGIGISNGSGNIIGGTASGARNIISGNTNTGVILGGESSIMQGNYIGLNSNGDGVISNGASSENVALISTSNNIIGGSTAAARNVIAGASAYQIAIYGGTPFGGGPSTSNKIQGNYLGTDSSGVTHLGFGAKIGMFIALDAQNNLIGGADSGEGNLIVGNGAGIGVSNFSSFEALNNSILGNSIYNNTGGIGPTTIGIDLLGSTTNGTTFTDAGVTPNDAGDTDVLSNHLMNFPVISSVTSTSGQATITYDLDINDSEAGATGYRVEFFANDNADPTNHGQGQTYLGSDTVSGDVTGRQATITLPSGVDGSKYITATTTMTDNSTDGFGHTSEFAADVQATLVPATPSPAANVLATTGLNQNRTKLILVAIIFVLLGGAGLYVARRQKRI